MELGQHIRKQREGAGISIRVLASKIGVNATYLSRVERGLVPPSDDLLDGVAKALGCSAEELFVLAGSVPPAWKKAIAESPEKAAESMGAALAGCVAEPQAAYGRTVMAFGWY